MKSAVVTAFTDLTMEGVIEWAQNRIEVLEKSLPTFEKGDERIEHSERMLHQFKMMKIEAEKIIAADHLSDIGFSKRDISLIQKYFPTNGVLMAAAYGEKPEGFDKSFARIVKYDERRTSEGEEGFEKGEKMFSKTLSIAHNTLNPDNKLEPGTPEYEAYEKAIADYNEKLEASIAASKAKQAELIAEQKELIAEREASEKRTEAMIASIIASVNPNENSGKKTKK
ncbi:MAG: hypothetical protein ACSHYB_15510 [Roseibacillus sp.]